jgi:hypothetical protein
VHSTTESAAVKKVIQQKIDKLVDLSARVRSANVTDAEIDKELRSMIIVITVNLKSSERYITALKDLADFILQIRRFLMQARNRGVVSDDTFQKNLSFLRNKLSSCDKLPERFAKDQLSLLNDR